MFPDSLLHRVDSHLFTPVSVDCRAFCLAFSPGRNAGSFRPKGDSLDVSLAERAKKSISCSDRPGVHPRSCDTLGPFGLRTFSPMRKNSRGG